MLLYDTYAEYSNLLFVIIMDNNCSVVISDTVINKFMKKCYLFMYEDKIKNIKYQHQHTYLYKYLWVYNLRTGFQTNIFKLQ